MTYSFISLLMGKQGKKFNFYTWRKSYKNATLENVSISDGCVFIKTEDGEKAVINLRFVTSLEILKEALKDE